MAFIIAKDDIADPEWRAVLAMTEKEKWRLLVDRLRKKK